MNYRREGGGRGVKIFLRYYRTNRIVSVPYLYHTIKVILINLSHISLGFKVAVRLIYISIGLFFSEGIPRARGAPRTLASRECFPGLASIGVRLFFHIFHALFCMLFLCVLLYIFYFCFINSVFIYIYIYF